jgi:hypothetical protein
MNPFARSVYFSNSIARLPRFFTAAAAEPLPYHAGPAREVGAN